MIYGLNYKILYSQLIVLSDLTACLYTPWPEKKVDQQYFEHNFEKFKYIVVIFGKEYYNGNVKLLTQQKSTSHNQCRYYTLQMRHWARPTVELLQREMPVSISPLMWPQNSPDLNATDYSVWGIL